MNYTMKRSECLESVAELLKDVPCLVTVGRAWTEWVALRPGPGNFQMKTLGSGSSLGLGLALALPQRKIVVIDGDGAVSMNVNGLLTVGRKRPKNLIHLVFDNRMYESSGALPTASTDGIDLSAVALASGIAKARRVDMVADFKSEVEKALTTDGPHFIVANVVTPGRAAVPAYSRTDEVEGKFGFIRFLEQLEGRKILEDAIDVRQSIQ
jgi:thiamine pyrophosphate-dependent acetolactate synthase large subunit-like protein